MSETTDQTPVQTDAQTPVPGPQGHGEPSSTPDGVETPENGPAERRGGREARYRVERNEAQAALVVANARVEAMQRAEVERLAADGLSHPSDLFSLSGNELADYLDDDGNVDPERVAADVAAVLAERPGLRRPSPAFDPTQGVGGREHPRGKPSWSGLFADA